MTSPPPAPTDIGKLLKQLRTQRGWSLRDVERRSGGLLRSGHLSQIETGKVRDPSLSVLRELAHTFDLSLKSLVALMNYEDDVVALDDYEDDTAAASLSRERILALSYLSKLTPEERKSALQYLEFLVDKRPNTARKESPVETRTG